MGRSPLDVNKKNENVYSPFDLYEKKAPKLQGIMIILVKIFVVRIKHDSEP